MSDERTPSPERDEGSVTSARWADVNRVFHRAVELSSDERQSYLDDECRGDEELRREVETLLRHDATGQDLLDDTAAWRRLPGTSDDDTSPLRSGQQIGDYQLLRLLGEGGMGVVYEARETRLDLDRSVAIKFLKSAALSEHAIERFREECRVLSRLEHENIARLYDAGITDGGLPYLVTELVEGRNARSLHRRSPPHPTRAPRALLEHRLGGLARAPQAGRAPGPQAEQPARVAQRHTQAAGLRHCSSPSS